MNWRHKAKLKHLITGEEDQDSLQSSMSAIADAAKSLPCFAGFDFARFYSIPAGDDVISACDYANRLVARLYDYADRNKIWIS